MSGARSDAVWSASDTTPGEVEDLRPPRMQDPGYYAWAWEDAGIGELRARYFATDVGIGTA